ncbi:MAG: HlyD family secretion protein [Flavobacteriales bacterium]|nr:HlyD family secretion protein [Flavobacteriales bacterium]MCX7768282.1 HlyD family secretion protein [Flavobacteriales bacterium]MDW8410523.1 HlyD family efflux transporter periplasmic adaptor subunit [Flavobacteriales bacterium]
MKIAARWKYSFYRQRGWSTPRPSPLLAFEKVYNPHTARRVSLWLRLIMVIIVCFLFVPWTQNFQTEGQLTTLTPNDRPQEVPSTIAGSVVRWYVREGQFVREGDTLLQLSEVRTEFFDTLLIKRTARQVQAKEAAVDAYINKIKAYDAQIMALESNLPLKLNQARNKLRQVALKLRSDSMAVVAADTNLNIARLQLERARILYRDGIKPRQELEDKLNKYQEAEARLIRVRNELLISQNEYINAQIELNTILNEFNEKISKAESEREAAKSLLYATEAEIAKLQTQLSSYIIRSGFYFITAPQSGYVVKTLKAGIGEIVKEGEPVATIVPARQQQAVELYVRPMDLPLVRLGHKVRVWFDGWPALVFSGWPNASYGTYGGIVAAIDYNISPNGKYRVLVKPDPTDHEWPKLLRMGTGARGIFLLNNVPLWYELWRQFNGFPPDFYYGEPQNDSSPGGK